MHWFKHLALAALSTAILVWSGPAAAVTTNDPLLSQQWGFDAMDVQEAWGLNFGGRADVRVAVIDGGVAYDLPDFASTRFDLDAGWDFVDDDANPYDGNGHGTHVAATIAESTNNGQGAAGIAFNTTIIPMRVLNDSGGGSFNDLVDAIDRAIGVGADIINLSLGSFSNNAGVAAAIDRAYQAGVLVVAAAGNNSIFSTRADYPAYYGSTIAVGAINSDLSAASYSSPVYDANGYGLSAPGTDILQVTQFGETWYSGTSMSAAMVSGVAALALSEALDNGKAPAKNAGRVDWLSNLLYGTALDLGARGPDIFYGYGLVQADAALLALQ